MMTYSFIMKILIKSHLLLIKDIFDNDNNNDNDNLNNDNDNDSLDNDHNF